MSIGDREQSRPLEILLVEDDPGDALMTEEALAGNQLRTTLHVVDNGVDALAFLRREPPYTEAPTADLVLLDLNLPRMNGHEVLAEIKGDAALRRIPVIVLTTSEAEQDVVRSYQSYANAYITKPVDFERFVQVVKQVDDFFLGVVRLPPNGVNPR